MIISGVNYFKNSDILFRILPDEKQDVCFYCYHYQMLLIEDLSAIKYFHKKY